MASQHLPTVPIENGTEAHNAAVQRPWRMASRMSSLVDGAEQFLATAGFDKGPWLVVAFASGIAAWFVLDSPWEWVGGIGFSLLLASSSVAVRGDKAGTGGARTAHVRRALAATAVLFALGIATIWLRSEIVGATPIERPTVTQLQGYVIDRENQPAQDRIRVTMAVRDAEVGMARKIRINIPIAQAGDEIAEGAVLRLRARLLPPASPLFPGSYDFARAAWFRGLSATGTAMGEIEIVRPAAPDSGGLARVQRTLSQHVQAQLDGAPGTIAAAFASGDRGSIDIADEEAMRDAGLTHLLSISGLHVSAVIGAAYLLVLKILALWPALALRIRLPVVAAACAALAGIGYTLLTGAEVPTVRSCIAALLVLGALALGREALSLRMVAVAAFVVLLLWPESLVGPSFQMSFAAVIAIVALHNSAPIKAFLAPRDEGYLSFLARRAAMLLVTGLVIEIALMPIVLFHFHRAGMYGALANVAAIPLVTFISMPLIALALLLDSVGLGGPVWWLVGKSLDLLIAIAHWTAAQPGAVKLMPQMGGTAFGLFVIGGLWLALWQGNRRLAAIFPIGVATALMAATPVPDILISRDGRHVGIIVPDPAFGDGRLLSLRESRSDYASDSLRELAASDSELLLLDDWPDANCSPEFCTVNLLRGGQWWSLLLSRSKLQVEERALAAACERADVVVSDRRLPASCKPRWLKADRRFLEQSGGLAISLESGDIQSVADHQGEHGWWRAGARKLGTGPGAQTVNQ